MLYNKNKLFALIFIAVFSSCDRTSSPEERLSIQLEDLEKKMVDSLKQQNAVMLDSLSKIREDIEKLQRLKK